MIIKSHIRGGIRAAAAYLKDIGENEKMRLVSISDIDAKNLNEAFHNMWALASTTRATKPLHHISINPFKDERLTDSQALKIVERCEQKYGYKSNDHQRVIVEHIKDGRQHFHVMWCRVSLATGKPVWAGQHWNKSKQVAREMEKELGLKRPTPKRVIRAQRAGAHASGAHTHRGCYATLSPTGGRSGHSAKKFLPSPTTSQHFPSSSSAPASAPAPLTKPAPIQPSRPKPSFPFPAHLRQRLRRDENIPDSERFKYARRPDQDLLELLAWAWEHKRADILASFGIHLHEDYWEP